MKDTDSYRIADFVVNAHAAGHGLANIRHMMLEAGWSEDEADDALGEWYETKDGTLVPKPAPDITRAPDVAPAPLPNAQKSKAAETLLYLIQFVTFLIAAGGVIDILFAFINVWYPYEFADTNVRQGLSALIVAFPLYLGSYALTVRALQQDPEGASTSAARRWMLSLIMAACVIPTLFDVSGLVYRMLSGDETQNGTAKSVVFVGLALLAFLNYRWEYVHGANRRTWGRMAFVVSALIGIVAVAAAGIDYNSRWVRPAYTYQVVPKPAPAETTAAATAPDTTTVPDAPAKAAPRE